MKITNVLLLSLIFVIVQIDVIGQPNDLRLYIAGHSLIDHRPPRIATPSDETTVAHWLHDIAQFQSKEVHVGGQYGFLTNHDDLSFSSQWGYDNVPAVWESEEESFSDADINAFMITAANFIQYVPPTSPHPLDGSTTVVEATERVFDWVAEQESSVTYYIYSNWPEMDLENSYPPTEPSAQEVSQYHQETIGSFNDWWEDYQDELLDSRPALDVRLIPVGPIISRLLTGILEGAVPFAELYEDSDPHGRPTLYFLAGAITYMAMYEERISSSYQPSTEVHVGVRSNLGEVISFIWSELQAYNLPGGGSRVFRNRGLPIDLIEAKLDVENCPPRLSWKTANAVNFYGFEVEYRFEDEIAYRPLESLLYDASRPDYEIEVAAARRTSSVYYRIKLIDEDGDYSYSRLFMTDQTCASVDFEIYPNPLRRHEPLTIYHLDEEARPMSVTISDLNGRIMKKWSNEESTKVDLLDVSDLYEGLYLVRTSEGLTKKLVVVE